MEQEQSVAQVDRFIGCMKTGLPVNRYPRNQRLAHSDIKPTVLSLSQYGLCQIERCLQIDHVLNIEADRRNIVKIAFFDVLGQVPVFPWVWYQDFITVGIDDGIEILQ